MTDPQKFAYSDYTVGWICALPETELVAAIAMLDERHPVLPATDLHDANTYALGRIGDHNVVIACLPAATTGKVSAANVAKDMIRSFPAVRFGLMVGIGGGAPYYGAEGNGNSIGVEAKEDSEDSEDDMEDIRDIRLGDVVISLHSKSSDAVVQYDFGKSLQESEFIQIGGKLNKPPNIVLGAVAQLKAQYELKGQNNISKTLADMISSYPALGKRFQYPGSQKDFLFKSDFVHEAGKKTCKACRSQNNNLVKRDSRSDNSPQLHYGTIGSADQVMKDAVLRDRWAREKSIICFEMEAAGLMDSFPCLVIRGICDYADSHKNKVWQPYSAATAASYAKEILHIISGQGVVNMDPIKQIERSIREVHCAVENTSATVQVLSIDSKHKKVFDKLPYVEGSSFDALDAEHEVRCHPETRVDLLHQILEWAKTPNQECIFWLNGMAGTGKSTISRTIAQLFKEKGQLGASFFFKRGEGGRDSAKRFFTTICAQLLLQVPALIRHVELAIDTDPYISGKSIKEQFNKLLLGPLLSLDQNKPTTIVIVIDALDECEHKDDIRAILQLLPQLQGCTTRHIRIFLTSRPELPIRPIFEESNNHRCLVLHELSNTVVEKDIYVFLKHELLGIKRRRKISGEWPGDDVLKTLVKRAVPLFISAATVCRFVDDPKWRPEKRLQTILEDPAATSGSQMDRTYLPVLNQLLLNANEREIKQLKQEFQDIVGVIILLATPLSVNTLSQLINLPSVDVNNRLDGFHSVLSVPENINAPVRILHLSFRDFLINTKSTFYVDKQETHRKIASHCLRVMETRLKHNICGLASYGTEHKDIDSQVIKQHLTAELQYSSRYWVYHLEQSEGGISESEILSFLRKHFLHWLEALALIGSISNTIEMIDILKSNTWKSIGTEISDFLYDAKRFALQNTYIAGIAPLQLYGSGLVFTPTQSISHLGSVLSVAFSPDGCTLVSGSRDHTIKLWDTMTGTERQTLKGHSSWVKSVAFSPDGRTLASGSGDDTIKLWDTTTGTERQTLKGHSDSVQSVAFSPDGYTLA
ncbi:hypothetical protein BDV38DRAFT_287740, partial [Aspergillus pseudotamarii]